MSVTKTKSGLSPAEFRRMALGLAGAVESAHMNHPDFRVGGKIFATLGYPSDEYGMANLTPDAQRSYLRAAPNVFSPCSGQWGARGATHILLAAADAEMVRGALECAWQKVSASAKRKR